MSRLEFPWATNNYHEWKLDAPCALPAAVWVTTKSISRQGHATVTVVTG